MKERGRPELRDDVELGKQSRRKGGDMHNRWCIMYFKFHCTFPTIRVNTWLCVCKTKCTISVAVDWISSFFFLPDAISSSSVHGFGTYVLDFSLSGDFMWLEDWVPNLSIDVAKVACNHETLSQSILVHNFEHNLKCGESSSLWVGIKIHGWECNLSRVFMWTVFFGWISDKNYTIKSRILRKN